MNKTISGGCGLHKLLVVFLSVLLLAGMLPTSAFAAAPEGQRASSSYGDVVTGSDGQPYRSPSGYVSMTYHSDGTTEYVNHSGGNAYKHYVLTDSAGASRWVYCVESGIRFGDSDDGYLSSQGQNSQYFSQLPAASQRGVMLTTLYGWQPGAALPLSGINENDWYMAAQCIVWEYQQQLRSDPYSRHDNGPIDGDQFYSVVRGRPAERAYNWILEQAASHATVPSFASADQGGAPALELEWDPEAKVYRLTVTDTNNLNIDLQTLAGSGVTVTRDGNRYTFTSKSMIDSPVTLQYRKNVPVGENMLIWGRPGYQTMMTGARDPVAFFVRVQTETYGRGGIVKTSEDGVVEGFSFRITGEGVDQTVTTGADGRVELDLLPGVYLVTEQPIDRYVTPAAQYITIESGQTSTVHFSNILKKFRVKLQKSDADTGTAQGDASLAGAQYGLYKGGELVETFTTGPDGGFLTGYYVCGDDWTIREISPSTGYLLDETVHEAGASPRLYEVELNTTENHVTEKVIYGNIQLVKHTDDPDPDVSDTEHSEDANAGQIEKPEAGARFEIFLKAAGSYENSRESERDLLTTDGDGFAASKLLPFGRYTVHQVAGEEGKAFVPDFTVFISANGCTYSYILNNDAISARVKVEKHDAETGEIIPMPGTGFRIKDLSTGEFITQQVYYPNPETLDTFYVSDEGWLMLPEPLPVGDFELYEVQAPSGYVLGGEPVPFTIDGAEAVVTVVQKNMPQKGQITIAKTGEVFYSVQENGGLYQPVYKVMGLPGAVYDLIADEDITTGDGTVRAAKDTVVETLTTGEGGAATSSLLYLGRYRLEERTAPAGMVQNTEPVHVELAYAGQEVEITQTATGLYDQRQKVKIDLTKSLEADEVFQMGQGEEYKDISFGLYAADALTALDGSAIPAGGLLEVVSAAPAQGGGYAAAFASDLPFGSFFVQERATNNAYVLNDQKYPAVFEYAGQDTATVALHVNGGKAIPNTLIRGKVDGVKYGEAPEGGDPLKLAGAVMGLFPPDTEQFTKKSALLTTTTAKNGAFSFEGVPFGHWIVAEISSPALYTISPEQHHVYISSHGQSIGLQVDNTLIRGSVQVIKTEMAGQGGKKGNPFLRRLPGAVFELFEDANGNKKLDGDDKLLGRLKERDGGLHQWDGLLAQGYFIKEKKAPKGYELDKNAYYFEITEDGQTVVIENEAGRGFLNEARRGDLKIMKDSSDGRRDGFAFEVKSRDGSYCETFTSGRSGVIIVEDLRIGRYTVTEVRNKASEGYILPAPATFEVKTGETVLVQFFNEKPGEETPDKPTTPSTPQNPSTPTTPKPVPQTGDDYSLYLWVGLLGLAVIGCGVCAVLYLHPGKHRKSNPKRRKAASVALLMCVALIVGSAYMLAREISQYRAGTAAYDGLAAHLTVPEAPPAQGGDDPAAESEAPEQSEAPGADREADPQASPEPSAPAVVLPDVDFTALQEKGPDVAAWLTLPETVINYPVVQGEDNEYYLKRLYDGTKNKAGCLFIDYENAPGFADRNTIVYGHNMRDGSMFASLLSYAEQDYYDAHPSMLLMTPEGGYVVELFSAFVAGPGEAGTDASPWALAFKDSGAFTTWLAAMQGRSLFQSEVSVTSTDRVLTLSTCTGSGKERFIVMGKLVPVT